MYTVLEQRSREWGVPLFISTKDFTKAFDSIKHSATWNSLRFDAIKPAFVKLLQKLYKQQEGTVLTDKESEVFPVTKRDQARRPAVISSFQHGVAVLAGEQTDELAREQKRYQAERPN